MKNIEPLSITLCARHFAVTFITHHKITLRPRLKVLEDLTANCVIFDNPFMNLMSTRLKLRLYHGNDIRRWQTNLCNMWQNFTQTNKAYINYNDIWRMRWSKVTYISFFMELNPCICA